MTDRPVLEAVGEVLASWDGNLERFRKPVPEVREWYLSAAIAAINRLNALGWTLSPTPIVNQPFERVPTHAGDPGYGPIPPETNVVHIDRDTPATPIVNAGEER